MVAANARCLVGKNVNYYPKYSNPPQHRHNKLYKSEDDCLPGCCAIRSGRNKPTYHSCLLPPPSARWPDDGGSKHLWNVSQFIPDYMATCPHCLVLKATTFSSHKNLICAVSVLCWSLVLRVQHSLPYRPHYRSQTALLICLLFCLFSINFTIFF
jgi:hypothetical protein